MNERLGLQDLIDLLAKKRNITKKEAEIFLREFVAIISESIESDDFVRIKDFGVFKLIKVNARKSVDVNTGEAIEIPAHYKLGFTPDKSLKEAINRPFAHFESIILKDGVSFENVESETDEGMAEEQEEASDAVSVEDGIAIAIPEKPEDKAVEENTGTETDSNSLDEEAPAEDIPGTDAPVRKESEAISSRAIDKASASTDIDTVFYNYRRKSKRRRFISLCVIIFLALATFVVGGYYFRELEAFLTGKPPIDNSEKIVIVFDKKTPVDSLANERDSTLTGDTIPPVTNEPELQNVESEQATATTAQPLDSSQPLATETIRRGHTLRNIALKYYGHKSFWVYIHEENKDVINDPNNIPLGAELVIPAPSKYGIDPENPDSVEKAKRLETELFREMGL
ncbi:MAG: HU family DNA-binding protein [Prevotella sp.]|jgi:nucleoid DNA-binding protein|nr:HU family DNA-binding protein [Prevotella sp.]